jgi:hypothetical protein
MTWSPQTPPQRTDEPATFAPPALLILMAFMLALHAWRALVLGLFEEGDIALLKPTAFVAARFSLMAGLATPGDILREVATAEPAARPLLRYLAQTFLPGGGAPWTLVSYAFLHAGWEHVIFNSLWLLVFGAPVMQRFGLFRFAVFFARGTCMCCWGRPVRCRGSRPPPCALPSRRMASGRRASTRPRRLWPWRSATVACSSSLRSGSGSTSSRASVCR